MYSTTVTTANQPTTELNSRVLLKALQVHSIFEAILACLELLVPVFSPILDAYALFSFVSF